MLPSLSLHIFTLHKSGARPARGRRIGQRAGGRLIGFTLGGGCTGARLGLAGSLPYLRPTEVLGLRFAVGPFAPVQIANGPQYLLLPA